MLAPSEPHHRHHADDEERGGQLQVAQGVGVDGRRRDLAYESRCPLGEALLDLEQDPLFVFGERHQAMIAQRNRVNNAAARARTS